MAGGLRLLAGESTGTGGLLGAPRHRPGTFAGSGAEVPRIGFRHPPALYEGPSDVLRFALRRIGDEAGADEAERLYQEAKAARDEALASGREAG